MVRLPQNATRSIWLILVVALWMLPSFAFAQEKPAKEPSGSAGSTGYASSEEKLLQAADEIAAQVARIRGLEVLEEIDKGIKKREELRAVLIQKLAEEVRDEDIEAEGKVFQQLGLIAEDVDYKKVLLDVLTEQIAGFYDQKTKSLYIMQGIPLSLQRPAMAHEIFHAIQDQHFDILRLQAPFSTVEHGDFALARSALIEGDATVVMFDFSLYEAGTLPQDGVTSVVDIPMIANILKRLSFDDLTAIEKMFGSQGSPGGGFGPGDISDSALAKAPSIFRDLLMFPYFAGMRFIVMARTGSTWEQVNQIYSNPPVSTEQILHPERYFAGDTPMHLSFDASPALADWSQIYDSVLGEFQMLLFLRHHLADSDGSLDPSSAATGWDGDRLIAFERDGEILLTHLSEWDSEQEAREFYEALRQVTKLRKEKAVATTARGEHGESTCYLSGADGADGTSERTYVERWGNRVLYVDGAPSRLDEDGRETDDTMFRLRQAIWRSHVSRPIEDVIEERLAEIESVEKDDAASKPSEQ